MQVLQAFIIFVVLFFPVIYIGYGLYRYFQRSVLYSTVLKSITKTDLFTIREIVVVDQKNNSIALDTFNYIEADIQKKEEVMSKKIVFYPSPMYKHSLLHNRLADSFYKNHTNLREPYNKVYSVKEGVKLSPYLYVTGDTYITSDSKQIIAKEYSYTQTFDAGVSVFAGWLMFTIGTFLIYIISCPLD